MEQKGIRVEKISEMYIFTSILMCTKNNLEISKRWRIFIFNTFLYFRIRN